MRYPAVILTILLATSVPAAAAERGLPFSVSVVGQGPAIVFIPGLNSSGAVWDAVVAALRERYTCHVLTLAGFAGEPAIAPPFLPTMRDAVLQYIRDRRLDRPVIVGHSLGGVLALWLGASAPHEVGRIVTIDGVPFLPGLTNAAATAESIKPMAIGMRDAFLRASDDDRARQTALSLPALVTNSTHVKMASAWAAASDPATTGQAMMEVMTTDLRPEMSRIESPVLLVAPDAPAGVAPDRFRRSYEQQFAALRDHRVVFLANTRHFVMLDDPESVLSAVNAFLK
jgi:pimeloyl-ACP methyl ester carboxylesterase